MQEYVFTHAHTHAHMQVLHIHTHTHMQIHTHTYTHGDIHINTYIKRKKKHTQTHSPVTCMHKQAHPWTQKSTGAPPPYWDTVWYHPECCTVCRTAWSHGGSMTPDCTTLRSAAGTGSALLGTELRLSSVAGMQSLGFYAPGIYTVKGCFHCVLCWAPSKIKLEDLRELQTPV